MVCKIFKACLNAIMDETSIGYSYINSFVEVLWQYKKELNLEKYVVTWKVFLNDTDVKYFSYYSDNMQFDLSQFDIDGLMQCNEVRFIKKAINIIAIPINGNANNTSFFATYGLILLYMQGETVTIPEDELYIYHNLLNKRIPNVLCEKSTIDALQIISNAENLNCGEFTCCLGFIGDSLDRVSGKSINMNRECGLRHFSLWNYIRDCHNLKMKQFSRNTYSECAHRKTHTLLNENDGHFINMALGSYRKSKEVQILRCFSYNDVRDSFIDEEYFINIGLNDTDTTIIVAANGEQNSDIPDRILNYYINNIVYTPFISKLFIKTLTRSITNNISKNLISCRDRIISELINKSMNNTDELHFYEDIKTIIKEANEADDVLIYLKEGSIYEQKPQNPQSLSDNQMVVPSIYAEDKSFCSWLKQVSENNNKHAFYIAEKSNGKIFSSLFLRSTNIENKNECIIILLNKKHKPSKPCVYYNNVFDKDNYYVTEKCGPFLIHYQNMQDSINNKNYLLHKLRHEIPSCTEAIEQGLNDIKDTLTKVDVPQNYILTITQNMALNNSRILLLAKFFSTVGFDIGQFAKEKINVNLRTFLSSYIEIFREEGKYKGVDVYFEMRECDEVIVQVSNYFQLALVNVITNAIRYAASGTCVYIGIYPDKIEVCDIGIGITKEEQKQIFKEGYRGNEARRVNEKGMGYGLYLTKKVLDAHNLKIEVQSLLYFNQNYFAQMAVCRYLNSMNVDEKRKFIYKDLDEVDKAYATRIYDDIRGCFSVLTENNIYANLKMDTIKHWLMYIGELNCVFYDMEDIFKGKIHEVVFTINLK